MHNPFEPELLSGRLEFQLNEGFHYPISKLIAGGMPKVDLPDDLQVLIAADAVAPVVAHVLNFEKSGGAQAELEGNLRAHLGQASTFRAALRFAAGLELFAELCRESRR